jgi:hypothetical protein
MTRGSTRPAPGRMRVPRPVVFIPAGGASALAVGIPTDVIDTARWWEYPVLALTALLTAMWAASRSHRLRAVHPVVPASWDRPC